MERGKKGREERRATNAHSLGESRKLKECDRHVVDFVEFLIAHAELFGCASPKAGGLSAFG